MSSPKQIAHFVLGTKQFELLIDWYLMFLDAKLRFKNDTMALISFDDEHHRIGIVNMNIIKPEGELSARNGTLRHMAFSFATVSLAI